ncbi:MAG: RHS repeat-associated core domain-containing protein [Planctomycetota bacterium]
MLASISVDADGKTSKSLSDGAGRMVRSVDQLAKVTTYEYDAGGNRLKIRDPNSVGQDCLYDALGRQTQCTDTGSDVTKSSYDLAGNKVTSTDAKNEDTTYTYDARGRQIKQTDRLGGETEFAYTDMNRLSSLTDAENQVTSYTYDSAGFKLTETYPDHTGGSPGASTYGVVTFTPDAAGRVLRKQDQLGDTVTYNYDLAGRLTSRQYRTAANRPSGTVTDTDSFTYDDAGRTLTAVSSRYTNTITYTYDNAGRKSTEALTISGQTYTVTTAYDTQGRVSTLTYPDGTSVGRTYTDRSQLATITVASTTIDTRTYDDGGRMTASSYNNGVSESRTFNNDNTLASIGYTGAAIGNLTYGWDANKNKTSEGIAGTMSGYGFDVGTSGYDDEDRLVNWERDDTNLDQSWSLSLVGDWSSYTENGSTQNRTHGPTHELLTAATQVIEHDAKGNMTLIPGVLRPSGVTMNLTWDFDNRLSTADIDNDSTVDVTYKWDALGRRVFRDDGTAASVYVQNGQQTVADYTSGTAASSPTYNYVYASYIDEPVLRTGTGGDRYYHRGQQYSITALTDGTGAIQERYAYDAYGGLSVFDGVGAVGTATAEGNRYTYTGRELDEDLDLYHYRARMYDPVAGRFYGRDPIAFSGSRWGLYEFVSGVPTRGIDPSGLLACLCQCHPGQPAANHQINQIVNDTIDGMQGRPVRNHLVDELITGTPFETNAEIKIKESSGMWLQECEDSASVMIVQCGTDRFCIGTDKIGHFFEEGLAYYDIAVTHGHGLEYAIGWGEWTEGLVPNGMDPKMWGFLVDQVGEITFDMAGGQIQLPGGSFFPQLDWFGYFGDYGLGDKLIDPNGGASPADLAANLAGYYFWDRILNSPEGRPPRFEICDFIHPGWDHRRNPNKKEPLDVRNIHYDQEDDSGFVRVRHGHQSASWVRNAQDDTICNDLSSRRALLASIAILLGGQKHLLSQDRVAGNMILPQEWTEFHDARTNYHENPAVFGGWYERLENEDRSRTNGIYFYRFGGEKKLNLEKLKQFQGLRGLAVFDGRRLDENAWDYISESVDLQLLVVPTSRLDDKSFEKLLTLEKLRFLDVSMTEVSDDSIGVFEKMKSLKTIGISGTKMTLRGAEILRSKLPGKSVGLDRLRYSEKTPLYWTRELKEF